MEKADLNYSELSFGYLKTDRNYRCVFKDDAWGEPEMSESEYITMHISACCLHYGQLIFEGLKVYERPDGKAQAFRVEENAKRFIRSAEKLLMEPVTVQMFKDAVWMTVNANRRFVPPHGQGATMYVRPFEMGTGVQLGVNPSNEYTFMVFVSPVGPYYKGKGLSTVNLVVERDIERAAPHGTGNIKCAGNYAAGLSATIPAKKKGFSEVLYLDSVEKRFIDESGSSNFFGITKDGTYVTPASSSILPSITNMSIKQIARDKGIKVEERPVDVKELKDFAEAGAVGTAAVISPIGSITDNGEKIVFGDGQNPGPITTELYNTLTAIQNGLVEDPYGWTEIIPE
ncbi:MAG TPA: branched-chain amino acid aminotransferase [bacterium]|nr:branched-chain amino acid aminotransferase [bacterium]